MTVQVDAKSQALANRHEQAAREFPRVLLQAERTMLSVGQDSLSEALVTGKLGLNAKGGQAGLADCIRGWMIDEAAYLGALGVPENTPAAIYARILNDGGIIRPRQAKALAIPVSSEAKLLMSPREQEGLVLIRPKGQGRCLLVRSRGRSAGFDIQWVLVSSVYIYPRFWFSILGAAIFGPAMRDSFEADLAAFRDRWNLS